jgi:hypothetical protein
MNTVLASLHYGGNSMCSQVVMRGLSPEFIAHLRSSSTWPFTSCYTNENVSMSDRIFVEEGIPWAFNLIVIADLISAKTTGPPDVHGEQELASKKKECKSEGIRRKG